MTITPDEQDALMHGLPLAWPQLENFADESEEDDARLAAGAREAARILRLLYDRLEARGA